MKLMIDIPDNIYDAIKEAQTIISGQRSGKTLLQILVNSVENGTPISKGHGRLGDLDALEKLCTEHNIANSAYDNSPIIEQGHYSDGDCIWKPLFDFAPTIIEADKVESEEN